MPSLLPFSIFGRIAVVGLLVVWLADFAQAQQASASNWDAEAKQARLLLAAGRPRAAMTIFAGAWSEEGHCDWPRAQVAYYIGLCHTAAGSSAEAAPWFKTAKSLAAAEQLAWRDDVALWGPEAATAASPNVTSPSWLAPYGWASLLAFAPDEDSKAMANLGREVRRARTAHQTSKSITDKVRLATWLLLYGEAAVRRPDLGCWTQALEALTEGATLLKEIDAAIDADPTIENAISEDPAVAMRFDVARARRNDARQAVELAREEERSRLSQLRRIIGDYRRLTQNLLAAQTESLLGDAEAAQKAYAAAIEAMEEVEKIARTRRDYHLFDDEPALDGDDEYAFVDVVSPALAPSLESAIQAVVAFQLLSQSAQTSDATKRLTLANQAVEWADKAAVSDSPLARLTSACAHDLIAATLAPQGIPAAESSSEEVQRHLDLARSHSAAVQPALKADAVSSLENNLLAAAVEMQAELSDSTKARLRADALAAKGDWHAALEVLKLSMHRRTASDALCELLDVRRLAGESPELLTADLQRAKSTGVIDGESVAAQIVVQAIRLDEIWKQVGAGPDRPLDSEMVKALTTELQAIQSQMATLAEAQPNGLPRDRAAAQAALAAALHTMLGGKAPFDRAALPPMLRFARDSQESLATRLAAAESPLDAAIVRDSLVVSRLALGQLLLVDSNAAGDEPLVAFAAAFDQAALLPYGRGEVRVLGTPLLNQLQQRGGSGGPLLDDERRLREIATRLAEASISLHLGNPEGAAAHLAGVSASAAAEQTSPDAGERLASLARLDDPRTLAESLAAVKALAETSAGRPRVALQGLIQTLGAKPSNDRTAEDEFSRVTASAADAETLAAEVADVQSPLLSYALAATLEAEAASMALDQPIEARRRLLGLAQVAVDRTHSLLGSMRLAGRFALLPGLADQAKGRLTDPSRYVTAAEELTARGRFAEATDVLEQGVRRHPDHQDLLRRWLLAQIDSTAGKSEADSAAMLDRIREAFDRGALNASTRSNLEGVVYERLNRPVDALKAYQTALETAPDDEQRLILRSRVASLRVKAALSRD